MQQFPVPQFIDVEDKIIGPITTRQFVLMLVCGLLGFLFFQLFTFMIFVIVTICDIIIFVSLAFVKINGRPVHYFLLNIVQTLKKPGLRVWNKSAFIKNVQEVGKGKIEETKIKKTIKAPVTGSRLDDLTLIVNTGGIYKADADLTDMYMQSQ